MHKKGACINPPSARVDFSRKNGMQRAVGKKTMTNYAIYKRRVYTTPYYYVRLGDTDKSKLVKPQQSKNQKLITD